MELQLSLRSQTNGSVKDVRIPLQDRAFIGRGAECEVRVEGDDISRRHVGLKVAGGQVTATDVSSNGSLLNGSKLRHDSAEPLKQGDVIGLPGWDVFIQAIQNETAGVTSPAATPPGATPAQADAGAKAKLMSTIGSFPFAEKLMVLISFASLALVWLYFKS